jgi:hypothetical protein
MRREYTIEDCERHHLRDCAINNMIAIFRRHGLNVIVEDKQLILMADTTLELVHQQEMAERALNKSGFRIKLRLIE